MSDFRIKTNFTKINWSLHKINRLQPVTFIHKKKNRNGITYRIGFIVHEVMNIIPSIGNLSHGLIDNVNTESNKNNI